MKRQSSGKKQRGNLRAARRLMFLTALVVLLCNLPPAFAQTSDEIASLPSIEYPPLDDAGFLLLQEGEDAPEFVCADEPLGLWIYLSPDLRVEIERFSAAVQRKNQVWFIAHIYFRNGEAFRAIPADPNKPRAKAKPETIAAKNKVVYAQNGDLFSVRVENKERKGLIIRNGKILYEDTYTQAVGKIPPLDELALFDDGHVEMRLPGEMSAQGYLDLGARDVLAFGPILFREDGVLDSRLNKSFTNNEPRSALGVVGPGHFVGIMVEGRNKRSNGTGLQFVAERLLLQGCREAFTLDGGQTAAMIFMGRNVMDSGIYNGYQKTRSQQDIVGIGRSDLVPCP